MKWYNTKNRKISFEYPKKSLLIAKLLVSRCAFCKLQRNFGFSCSVNRLADLLGNTTLLSIHFVCFCVLRFVACDRPVSGNNRLVFFEDFPDHSYSCLLPSTKSPLIIAISFAVLEQSRVILSFVFAGQARRVLCIVICIKSHWNDWRNRKTHSKFPNSQRDTTNLAINQATKKILAKIFLPKKVPKSKILNPKKSFDLPGHLKSGVPHPPELKLQKVLKSISKLEE